MKLDNTYKPKQSTLDALKKDGYTIEQIRTLWKNWTENHSGKEFHDLDEKFREVVRKEPAHGIKRKPDSTLKDIKERLPSNPTKGEVEAKPMSQEEIENWMKKKRFE